MKYVGFILAVLFTCISGQVEAQQVAEGTVFKDANGNGRADQGEQGIASVAVSNGREVVLTNEQGRYILPVDKDDILFVIKPSGFRLPVDERNRPQFYYIHKPEGSPELKYSGVSPTGPLPQSVNFPLVEARQKSDFKMLVFGDPQPYSRKQVDYFDRDIVSEVAGIEGYDLGISLGDLVGDDLDLFEPYTQSVARVGIPWFNVYGNHDMNFDASSDQFADETFERTFGPPTYSFNHGKVHFIVLDDVVYPRPDGESGYIGGFTDKQLTFIENDLKHVPKDRLVVLAFHIPIIVPEGRKTFRIENRDRLFDLLKEYPHTLSLSAHTHIQQVDFVGKDRGWQREKPHIHYNVGTTSGDWWSGMPDKRGIPRTLMRDGTPNGYASISFEDNTFTLDYFAAGYDSTQRMTLWGPRVVAQNRWPAPELYVNYFLGSEKTKVEYQIANRDWQSMPRVEESDPHVSQLQIKWDTADTLLADKRPSNPVHSTHLWSTTVPNDLDVGKQTIRVRVTDIFGRKFFETFSYQVVKSGEQ